MNFEIREWRALAVGWAAAVIVLCLHGVDFVAPVVAITVTVAVFSLGR